VLPEVFEALIAHTRQNFGMGVELDILSVLRRAKTESPFDVRQAMAARSLRFGFDNIRLPLGAVTAESFADVYSVASKNNSRPPSFLSVFFWSYDWDRGKELRVALVDAFLRSDWMPADLAIAAERAGILGKIFKRVRKSFMLWFLVALITLARLRTVYSGREWGSLESDSDPLFACRRH
jgi:predicted nucleic acid-binding Zn ribbon protein